MSDMRILNEDVIHSMLNYLDDVADEMTATLYINSISEHINALTDALEFIAGEAGWMDEATDRASEALSRIHPPDGKLHTFVKGELVSTSDE